MKFLKIAAGGIGCFSLVFISPCWASILDQPGQRVAAITMFLLFLAMTLMITWWSSKKATSASQFYTAEGKITAWQNGLAMAGDFLSAASFFGISGLVFLSGFDGLIYSVGFLVGWPILLFLMAERLRNLGRYTVADAASFRLDQPKIRVLSACSSLTIVAFYLIGQIVGSGKLIEILFGLPYLYAVILVGFLMMLYVIFGGMLATTWVQIIKAIFLLASVTFMALMIMKSVGFSMDKLFSDAVTQHPNGAHILKPGGMLNDPISAISLGIALMFGTAGLPHILMRFFTVKDAQTARKSVFYATGFIGYFYVLTFIIGFGAIVFLITEDTSSADVANSLAGGANMVALHLANALGGSFFMAFISAVAFATILAVVAGLTLSGASAISHDLYAHVFSKYHQRDSRKELFVSRMAAVGIGVMTILLGILFEKQNVAYMVGLAFAIAASTNFPVLLLSMYWQRLTTRGVLLGGWGGLLTTLVLVLLGPTIWVNVLGFAKPVFPYAYPALFSMGIAFLFSWLFSITDNSATGQEERKRFEYQSICAQLGRYH